MEDLKNYLTVLNKSPKSMSIFEEVYSSKNLFISVDKDLYTLPSINALVANDLIAVDKSSANTLNDTKIIVKKTPKGAKTYVYKLLSDLTKK